jgi:hypothetical protein
MAQVASVSFTPLWGILCKIIVLSAIITLPDVPQILLYYLSYALLVMAAVFIMGTQGYSSERVRFSFKRFPIQLLVGLTGVAFALAYYFILAPEPLIAEFTLGAI